MKKACAVLFASGLALCAAPAVQAFAPSVQPKMPPDGAVLRPTIRTLLKTKLSGYVSDWALDDSEGAFRVRVR